MTKVTFLVLFLFLLDAVAAYQLTQWRRSSAALTSAVGHGKSQLILFMDGDNDLETDTKKNRNDLSIDESTLVKLKAEATSPFRLLRQFVYIGTGAAGAIGTFTAIPQLIFALNDVNADKVAALTNIGIDLGAVVGAVLLWNKESEIEQKKVQRFSERQKLMNNRLSERELLEREEFISKLPVEIQVSERDENVTRIVALGDLQLKGRQNVVIVTGATAFVRDAVIAARIEGNDLFSSKNTIVVPFITNADQLDSKSEKGFGSKETLMTSPYIAKPQQVIDT